HRDAIARFQLRLFSSDPAYPRAQAAPYIIGVGVPPAGTVRYTDYNTFNFYKTIDQIWAATQGNERPFAGFYGPEARLNLMIAGVDHAGPELDALLGSVERHVGDNRSRNRKRQRVGNARGRAGHDHDVQADGDELGGHGDRDDDRSCVERRRAADCYELRRVA